jgi:hypothetical protein
MTEGFYYWRGRPLVLVRLASGRLAVRVPKHLVDAWRDDKRRGRLGALTHV